MSSVIACAHSPFFEGFTRGFGISQFKANFKVVFKTFSFNPLTPNIYSRHGAARTTYRLAAKMIKFQRLFKSYKSYFFNM